MTEQEAIAYIEEWDVTEAAKVLKWYEEDELLHPCDCDTIVAIETEDLKAENSKLRELLADTLMQPRDYCKKYGIEYESWDSANAHLDARMRELGIEGYE